MKKDTPSLENLIGPIPGLNLKITKDRRTGRISVLCTGAPEGSQEITHCYTYDIEPYILHISPFLTPRALLDRLRQFNTRADVGETFRAWHRREAIQANTEAANRWRNNPGWRKIKPERVYRGTQDVLPGWLSDGAALLGPEELHRRPDLRFPPTKTALLDMPRETPEKIEKARKGLRWVCSGFFATVNGWVLAYRRERDEIPSDVLMAVDPHIARLSVQDVLLATGNLEPAAVEGRAILIMPTRVHPAYELLFFKKPLE